MAVDDSGSLNGDADEEVGVVESGDNEVEYEGVWFGEYGKVGGEEGGGVPGILWGIAGVATREPVGEVERRRSKSRFRM